MFDEFSSLLCVQWFSALSLPLLFLYDTHWTFDVLDLADSLYMQFVARLTAGIIQTYQQCDPNFKYSDENNPKRFLTSPSIPAHNDGLDNANWDLILYVNLELVNKMSNRRLLFYNLVFNVPYLLISLYWNVPCYFGTQVYSQGNAWPGNIWSSCQMLGHRN